ncbi:MAG TPA: GTPase HflX [Phycisphaerae bacterium]|nr:GTPase HflX [Phycisphaerae bacterium]
MNSRTELSVRAEKAILVGVLLPDSSADPRDPLGELAALAKTAGAVVVARVVQQRTTIDPSTYIGSGKAEEIKKLVKTHKADVVIFDHDMSPNQLRDLEKIIDAKILDRSELILDIFATRARTHEAQLQVALAQLEYTYPRLRHMWSHLERIGAGAGAGVGARGPGEMQLEIDRRLVRGKVADLKERIAQVQARKSREVKERKRQHFTISLVGYTNAGKSTLFNTLTGETTFVEDKLFATLDTKTRRWHLGGHGTEGGGGHAALISDTVGFVRDLPHHLVASFKATLEEATHADMLLLVLDVSHPHAQQQLRTVVQVLKEIGCQDIPTLLVLNKIDALEESGERGDEVAFWKSMFPDALPASALRGLGVVALTDVVREQMLGRTLRARITVPLGDPKGITFVEKFSAVKERDYDSTPGSVELATEVSQRILDQLPNNVPSARVTRAVPVKGQAGSGWRIRTRTIKELIPDGFMEGAEGEAKAAALGLQGVDGARNGNGAGLSIGRRKLGV